VTLPAPETVVSDARADSGHTERSLNIAFSKPVNADHVERTTTGYTGESAGALGRLAAGVASGSRVHYPEPDFTVDGPWLVLAPLSGVISTVATGRGRAVVTLDKDATAGGDPESLEQHLSTLLDTVRPTHDHYPVEMDTQGVFTTGMTTFSVDSIEIGENLTATFEVSTTPATNRSAVVSRFESVQNVKEVTYEPIVGVERAAPSAQLREAVESAHRTVYGDWEYEWLTTPGVFAEIPSTEKIAVGAGSPKTTEFSEEQYESTLDVLQTVLSNLEANT
jgi:hypothetical protein